MLLDYREKIIQSQHKTVKRAVTPNMRGWKSSSELFPLDTTHTKVALTITVKCDSSLPHALFFSKKSGATAIASGKIARCSSSLLPTCD